MKKRQITKLFAVMALAVSPAAANPARPGAQAPAPAARTSGPLAPARTASVAEIGLAGVAMAARPRVLVSGAPACGNVASRSPQPVDCGRATPTNTAGGSVAPANLAATPAPGVTARPTLPARPAPAVRARTSAATRGAGR